MLLFVSAVVGRPHHLTTLHKVLILIGVVLLAALIAARIVAARRRAGRRGRHSK